MVWERRRGNRRGSVYFFFQAEDGIRDRLVTGVQTCALPIWNSNLIPGIHIINFGAGDRHNVFTSPEGNILPLRFDKCSFVDFFIVYFNINKLSQFIAEIFIAIEDIIIITLVVYSGIMEFGIASFREIV